MRERRAEVKALCATLRELSPDLLPAGKEDALLWALEVASSRAIGETDTNGTAATMVPPSSPLSAPISCPKHEQWISSAPPPLGPRPDVRRRRRRCRGTTCSTTTGTRTSRSGTAPRA